jgi:outer membrane protein TolC
VSAQIEVGKQPPSASAEVEVTIALRDEATLLAEQSLVERSIELERLMGQPATAERWLAAADDPQLERELPPPSEALSDAVARSPQLLLVRTQGRAAQIEVEVTANGLLPQLDLSFSGGTVGNAADAGAAFAQLGQTGSYSVSAGLVFQLPLQNRAARGTRVAAQHGLRRARLDEAEVRNQIAAAVARLCALARTAGQRAAVLTRSTDAAALDLAAERARFEVGRSSNFDVLRRQEEVALVQLGQARARVEQAKALAALAALSGRILDQFGVDVR